MCVSRMRCTKICVSTFCKVSLVRCSSLENSIFGDGEGSSWARMVFHSLPSATPPAHSCNSFIELVKGSLSSLIANCVWPSRCLLAACRMSTMKPSSSLPMMRCLMRVITGTICSISLWDASLVNRECSVPPSSWYLELRSCKCVRSK